MAITPEPRHHRLSFVAAAGMILTVTALFYAPFLDNFFAFDDFRYIENLFADTRTLLFGYNTTRFISNLVFVPLFAFSGFDPSGYNLFSMVLHGLNGLLVMVLAAKLSGRIVVGGLTGIIFAASAAYADAVLWKCANNTLISTFFSLTSLLLYLEWRRSGSFRQRAASIGLFVAAMFSKEDAAALPLLIACYELIFDGGFRGIRRATPYVVVVILYLAAGQVLMKMFGMPLEHYERFISFRPLYTLFGGFSVFLNDPSGTVTRVAALGTLGVAAFAVSLIVLKERRLFLFGVAGIIIAFLPSSISSLGSFTPKYIFQSVSRYLYFPSIMASLVLALLLAEAVGRLPRRGAVVAGILLLAAYTGFSYSHIVRRGNEWRREAEPVRAFLTAMQRQAPSFPRNSYVFAIDPPVGRAYVQQSLRAFYRDPTITWIADPTSFTPPAGSSAFVILCRWWGDSVDVRLYPFSSVFFR